MSHSFTFKSAQLLFVNKTLKSITIWRAIMPLISYTASVIFTWVLKQKKVIWFKSCRKQRRFSLLHYLLPPRFFLGKSTGAGNGFACLGGGGSCNLVSFLSISSLRFSPIWPVGLSWKPSTRAARVHFADTSLAAFFLRSYRKQLRNGFMTQNFLINLKYLLIYQMIHHNFACHMLFWEVVAYTSSFKNQS